MDDQLLSERFHAALDVELRAGAVERFRSEVAALEAPRRLAPGPRIELPAGSRRLVATALIVSLALAAFGAFLVLRQYVQNYVPANRAGSSVTCVPGFHMVTDKIGWQTPSSRTTDGGATWNDTKGGTVGCTLDAMHAWAIELAGPEPLGPDSYHVFATSDGGTSWSERGEVPYSSTMLLEFIDTQHGWLLEDNGIDARPAQARDLYSTDDGGYHWTRLASALWGDASVLGHSGPGCLETGLTFVSESLGWLSWDCFQAQELVQSDVSVLASTDDGGRTWESVKLPATPNQPDAVCAAGAPVIQGQSGLLAVSCSAGRNETLQEFARLYRTSDEGMSWTAGPKLPHSENVEGMDVVDPQTAFAFLGPVHDVYYPASLYRSDGKTWTLVKRFVFPSGQFVIESYQSFQFVDSKVGFAFVTTFPNLPGFSDLRRTTDGGITWTRVGAPSG